MGMAISARLWPTPWFTSYINFCIQGLYSLSSKKFYRQISWSLGAARLDVIMIVSLWNLTGILAALLPRCLSHFRTFGKVQTRISRLRDFTKSCGNTSIRSVNMPWRHPMQSGWNHEAAIALKRFPQYRIIVRASVAFPHNRAWIFPCC